MTRLGNILTILVLLTTIANARSDTDLIGNVQRRNAVSLNGAWRVIVDPYDVGRDARIFTNAKPRNKQEFLEYDFDTSHTLSVPGDWNSQRADLLFYEGTVWYKKSFDFQTRKHTRSFLHFGAAANRATVYLNGKKIGEHEGAYTPFDLEITNLVREGENFVVVEVNNRRRKDAVPSLSTDWWNYGGLTRDVSLVQVPETFIEDYFVQLAKGSQSDIAGWIRLNGSHAQQEVTLEIPEAKIRHVIRTDANGLAQFQILARLALWSPESPKLYSVKILSAEDSVTDEIGFRTIETRGSQILLNGSPVFLRGINIHEEAPFRSGRAFSVEDDTVLLGWAKELGCNFVRLAHYPHNEQMTRTADRLGLLVWSEVPVYWDTDWKNAATLQSASMQLGESIARDHNRASVALWSVANETPIDAGRNEFLRELIAHARKLDNTRLIAAALNHFDYSAPATRTLSDPVAEYLDVIGINEYIGWYESRPEDAERVTWKFTFNKPVVITEFGAEAQAGLHGSPDERWTEEYQARVYEQQIRMVQRTPMFAGMSPWLLMDFRSPRRLLPDIQDYHNRKGVISNRGERKKAFYVLQKFYKEQLARTE